METNKIIICYLFIDRSWSNINLKSPVAYLVLMFYSLDKLNTKTKTKNLFFCWHFDFFIHFKSETWPVQNENTSIQYAVWYLNTEVSVSVFNLKNTEYRGSPPYAFFGTWKKPCYMKFVLVGLYCGPLLTLIPPLTRT